ncbi:chromosome condensation protein CrcB [Actinoplanes awajinensis subsp. mycoplanecinus]|uniref:Fluoride-specific ion channel FluC n=1 Tax=Actinoplanes awajinensis subsp. mycoplanecinus TaxID=135947 RepID=A0A101JU19_9ACTN|nr:chromosome condensation protein CrcB [Actinoplanes awajinensis subsp. mycoplanecinus]
MNLDVDRRAIAAVAAGGVLGALARYGLGLAWPHTPAEFPWATWLINVSGCFLIGVLYTLLARFRPGHRLTRLFLGTGFLGGYTTFSTAEVDVLRATPAIGLTYLAATVLGALLAVWSGAALTEKATPAPAAAPAAAPEPEPAAVPEPAAAPEPADGTPGGAR